MSIFIRKMMILFNGIYKLFFQSVHLKAIEMLSMRESLMLFHVKIGITGK